MRFVSASRAVMENEGGKGCEDWDNRGMICMMYIISILIDVTLRAKIYRDTTVSPNNWDDN